MYSCPVYQRYLRSIQPNNSEQKQISKINLNNVMRMLWEQHVEWTRMAITGAVNNLPDADLTAKRLLENPDDFAAALEPFYGEKIASQFGTLLKAHLVIASQLVDAAKAGDNQKATELEKKWYANADEIAVFLGKINPYWSQEEWRKMLYEHLALTKKEAVDMITKNYADSINVYDEIEKQALKMADMMTEGILKQFPHMFT